MAKKDAFQVLYIGMASESIRKRLRSHARSARKRAWTHFSAFSVWPNITEAQIRELEGLLRHIYRCDPQANSFNLQRGYKAMKSIRAKTFEEWDSRTR